jgi:hypothetical protein
MLNGFIGQANCSVLRRMPGGVAENGDQADASLTLARGKRLRAGLRTGTRLALWRNKIRL